MDRSMVPEIDKVYTSKKYKNVGLILNGTWGGGKYGYKYGYKYGDKYGYSYGHNYDGSEK